jgi:hypothetical protein
MVGGNPPRCATPRPRPPLRRRESMDNANRSVGADDYCDFFCNWAYSALACLRMGMSGSASFHCARKS